MADAQPGQPFRVRASEWNAMRAAARALSPRSGGDGSALGLEPGVCLVKNDSGVDLPRFAVVGLSGLVCNPGSAALGRSDAPAIKCSPVTDPAAPFAILLEPVEKDGFGLARHSGIVICRIKARPSSGSRYYYAEPRQGETWLCQSQGGPVDVIAAQSRTGADENGLVWACLLLGWKSSGDDVFKAVVASTQDAVAADGLYTVGLSGAGLDSSGTTTNVTLALTDVCQGARLPENTTLLAHRLAVRSIPDGGD